MGLVSKEPVVLRRWEIDKQELGLSAKGQLSKRQLMSFKLSAVAKFKLSTASVDKPNSYSGET